MILSNMILYDMILYNLYDGDNVILYKLIFLNRGLRLSYNIYVSYYISYVNVLKNLHIFNFRKIFYIILYYFDKYIVAFFKKMFSKLL